MDLSFIGQLIPNVAGWLHVEPATVVALIGFILGSCNLAGRLIPDDADGWLGMVRKACKFLGAYASNRVSTGVKTSDVINSVVGEQVSAAAKVAIREKADQAGALIPAVIEDVKNEVEEQAEKAVADPFKKFADSILKGTLL